jgi:hypothetical protein
MNGSEEAGEDPAVHKVRRYQPTTCVPDRKQRVPEVADEVGVVIAVT